MASILHHQIHEMLKKLSLFHTVLVILQVLHQLEKHHFLLSKKWYGMSDIKPKKDKQIY